MSFLVVSIVISLGIIPTFVTFSFSQSNNTLPSELPSSTPLSNVSDPDESNDDTLVENDTSFASLSRSLAETNQSDDEQTPPPSTDSETSDEQTTSPPPSTDSEINGETDQEQDIQ